MLSACHQVETKQIFFRVGPVGAGCQILDCNLVTLQCIGSVQAVLTPEHGSPVTGPCTKPSGVATTLCDPTRLFPAPIFDQVSAPRVKLSISGYADNACTSTMRLFLAETPQFDVALAAASHAPVEMTATCPTQTTICAQVLNVQGNMVSWPPDDARDPPQIPGLNGYNVSFRYTFSDPLVTPPVLVLRKLFDVSYNPLPNVDHALTGIGQLTDDARNNSRCVGYEATSDPGVGLTTLTCVDKTLLLGTVQRLDAYYASPSIAEAAKAVSNNQGVLLVRVIQGGTTGPGQPNAIASARDFITGNSAMDRLFYYDSMHTKFVQTVTETDDSGVFAVVGTQAAGLISFDALRPGFGSTPTYTQPILPNVATVFELPL